MPGTGGKELRHKKTHRQATDILYHHLKYALFLLSFNAYAAETPLNFQVTPFDSAGTLWPGSCGAGGSSASGMCGIGPGNRPDLDPDTTPFFHGFVNINGVGYWHTIVGDPADGFAMESYVTRDGPGGVYPSNSGGKLSMFFRSDTDLEQFSGNGWDPLGLDPARNNAAYTGNATADPREVIVRQVMGGEWDDSSKTWRCNGAAYCSEFIKENRAYKANITQEINDDVAGGMSTYFQIDMSALDYVTSTTAGSIVNTLTLPTAPIGDFDMATDSQAGRSLVTGGRYAYTGCANPVNPWGNCWRDADMNDNTWDYDTGSYSYEDGGFNVLEHDWGFYLSQSQNPLGSGNEAKCDSGLISSSCP